MKKIAVVITIATTILLTGCAEHKTEENQKEETMLMVVDRSDAYRIYADKKTRVMYLSTKRGYGETLCVMVDADGNPLLWEGEEI